MRASKGFFVAVTALLGALAIGLPACSSSNGGGGTGGSAATGGAAGAAGATGGTGGTGGGSGTDGGSGSGGTAGTAGTDGGSSDGNDTMQTATPITVGGNPTQATLDPPGSDIDWYSFDGTAGEPLLIMTQAKTGSDPFDPTYLDLVVTLFDANGTQIAEQDDPTPRSSNDPFLLTVLPSAGKYYVRVLECNAWSKGGPSNCSDVTAITNKSYTLAVSQLTFNQAGEFKEAEPNNDATTATPMTFAKNPNQAGQYYLSTLLGTFSDASDVDVYSFTVPSDLAVSAGTRALIGFNPQPSGTDGNGSTTSMGEVYITTQADPATMLAKVDVTTGSSIDVPVTVGGDYLAFYKRAATPTGNNDFYFDLPGFSSSNPVETNDTGNDSVSTPEAVPASTTPGDFYIEGDLSPAATDVDCFSVAVPASAADLVTVACGAERSGSGLRGFTAALLKGDGSAISGGSATETASADLLLQNLQVPAGQTTLILRLSATSQASDVTSSFYRCGVHFTASTP